MRIAIVGIGCRFPGGADSPDAFWELLCAGAEAITEVPSDRFDTDAVYDPVPGKAGRLYTRRGGFIDGIDAFDADFFGISPREARRIDPQQRLLLEVVWEALEDGGQPLDALAASSTGVFVGISSHDYADIQYRPDNRHLIDAHVNTGNAASIAANRISYLLDLRGPSLVVDTACSSSLTAVHLACRSLASGECGLAVVGAANALLIAEPTIGFCQASMLSRDGRCRPFDARADGYVRSEGAGAIVLKPLDRALQDDDPIRAVIRGTAINQDGRTPGIAVPSTAAQEALLEQALRDAGVDPCAVQYVEAHGTGTPVGDPREARAIGTVMSRGRPSDRPCLIGSAKGNVGHLEAAAGIVGVIKTALALEHRRIPPTANYEEPNPAIPFDELLLRVPTVLEDWPAAGETAIAGVNSFGFGGANGHVVLEEPPARARAPVGSGGAEILTISARSREALVELGRAFATQLRQSHSSALGDLCYTAAVRRCHHEHRLAAVGSSTEELASHLEAFLAEESRAAVTAGRRSRDREPTLAFVFSGMGPQWWGMGRQLIRDEPVFRSRVEECDRLLRPLTDWSLVEELGADECSSRVAEADLAHVANLAIQVALVALWRSWGIVPDAVVGHSSGEMGAACAAGALALPDAVRLAYHRGRLQHRTTGTGGMLAAGISPAVASELLEGLESQVALAAVNGPQSVTFSGEVEALRDIADSLEQGGCFSRLLPVRVPYHGPQMDPLREELMAVLAHIDSQPPTIPIVSTVIGAWQDGRLFDAAYWWRNVRQPVLFANAIDRLSEIGCELFVEVSPHPVLAASVAECLEQHKREGTVLPSLRRGEAERTVMLRSLAALYTRGRRVQWSGVFARGGGCLRLPPYSWQRERHWLVPASGPSSYEARGVDSGHPLLGRRVRAARPTWELDVADPRLDYLDGHVVLGRIVFPAAAYVEIALAATAQVAGPEPRAVECLEFRRLLALREGNGLVLQCLVDERGSAIEVHSAAEDDPDTWTLRASVRLADTRPEEVGPIDLQALRSRCTTAADVEAYYRLLDERHGLSYTGAFRSVAALWRGEREAFGRIDLSAELELVAGYHVHPALLDAAFQTLVLAAGDTLDGGGEITLLPVSIRRVAWYASPGTRLWCHASVETSGDGAALGGTVRLIDDAGRLLVTCEGVRLRRLERESRESIEDWLYEERWEAEPRPGEPAQAIPGTGELAALAQPVLDRLAGDSLRDYYTTVEPGLNALAVRYAIDALHGLGFDISRDDAVDAPALADHLGVVARHRRYFVRLLELARGGESWGSPAPAAPLPADGRYGAAVALVRASGERLAETLRGKTDAREWLFAGDSLQALTELYAVNPFFAVYNAAVAEAVRAVQEACLPGRVRVLEVGSGTGGSTAAVLPRLRVETLEYVFTDISPFFVRSASERFRGHAHVRTELLDIEQPAAEVAGFDVVVAADVVHATADVRATLRNLRSVLVPGGLLVLLEAINRSAWVDLVFGQLEGWWRFAEDDLRPQHALLGVGEWERALEEAGFDGAVTLVDDHPDRAGDPAQAVFLAKAPTGARPPRATRRWLILTDRQGVGPEIASVLRERGDKCVLAWPGDAYRPFGPDGVALSPTSTADWARLTEEHDGVDGLIHLWSMDAPPEPTSGDVLTFQQVSCWGLVGLVQAFRAAGRTLPDVWLVTAGAHVVGDDDDPPSVAGAPLWGLGRVLRSEQAAGRCCLVDLGPTLAGSDVDGLLAELDADGGAEELAFRSGRRFVRRIQRASLEAASRAEASVPLSPDTASFRIEVARPGELETICVRETFKPEPGPRDVVVRVLAGGLNFRDVLVALDMPFVRTRENGRGRLLGLECAGVVEACGEAVDGLNPGDEVIAAVVGGAFASRVVASAELVAPKPRGLTFEQAATVPIAFLTAEYALNRLAHLAPGERVLVHSATGGVGLAAVQLARQAGAQVFATAGTAEKREYLESLGIDHALDSRSLGFADELLRRTGGEGVDVVVNSLAGEGLAASLALLRPYGRFVELGKRDIHDDSHIGLRPFEKSLSFFAVDLHSLYQDRPAEVGSVLRSLVRRIEAGKLEPLPHRAFDLGDAEPAFRLMAQARHFGKVILTVREPTYRVIPHAPERIFRSDGTYVVAGGLGGFGLAVASWMAQEGAGHIVLASRSGTPAKEDEAALHALRSTAADIVVRRCDVTDRDDVERLLTEIRMTMPPLKGVVHAAMVLDDGVLEKLDPRRFEAVLAPKVAGAWNLHELTLDDDLELFVLFSSISALLGPPTQSSYAAANAFLGALAAHRRAKGRPGVAVDWGLIADAGYVARRPELRGRLAREGFEKGIPAHDACAALSKILRHGLTRVAVSRVDLGEVSRGAAFEHPSVPLGDRTLTNPGIGQRWALSSRLATASPADRAAMLEHYLVQRTATVLGALPERVDLDRPLPEMGLDSLMAVELRTAVRTDLGVDVPIVDLLEGLTLRRLAVALLDRMEDDGPGC